MISVIGAGPAGLYSSYLLAKKNFEVIVFDRKKDIGLPVQCTGIVTSTISDLIDIKKSIIVNKINKICLHSKNNIANLKLKNPDLILNRADYDNFLAEKATKAGVKILLQHEFIKKDKNEIFIRDMKNDSLKKYKPEFLVCADGPLSKSYQILNPNLRRKFYRSIQYRVKGNFEKDTFHVYLGSISPDFFAWIVPENESIARIGLATTKNPKILFENFLKNKKYKIIDIQGGLIPIYDPKIILQQDNLFLIGDAASQLKSTTGGGIIPDLIASKLLCESISEKKSYTGLIKKNLQKDLWLHLKIRETLNRFNDSDYDSLIKIINNPKIKNILEKESRDNLSRYFMNMLFAEPSLVRFAPKIFF